MTTLSLLPAYGRLADCYPRFATPRNHDRETLGPDVAAIATRLGKPLMPWQRDAVDVAFELDPNTGKLWYTEVDVLVPRQSGKTTLIVPVGVHRAIAWSTRQNILYTAQSRKAARKKWEKEQLGMILESAFGRRLLLGTPRKANGDEGMTFQNGSFWGIDAPTETGGHGDTLGLAAMDEFWAQKDNRVEQALSPTMITVQDAQKWVLSTAGKHWSVPLKRKVDAGRNRVLAGLESRICYIEFSFPDDADPYDPLTWWANMPALGHTITQEKIQAEVESLNDEEEFRRAYGNQWREGRGGDWIIPQIDWMDQTDRESYIEGPMVWVPDVSPDMAAASISVAGQRADGRIHIEVVENLPSTTWLPTRTRELQNQYGGEVFGDLTGPLGGLHPRFVDEGINLQPVPSQELYQACGYLFDGIGQGNIVHLGQPELNMALATAAKTVSGDRWRFTRGKSMGDISSLMSVTIAAFKLAQTLPELGYDPLAGIL